MSSILALELLEHPHQGPIWSLAWAAPQTALKKAAARTIVSADPAARFTGFGLGTSTVVFGPQDTMRGTVSYTHDFVVTPTSVVLDHLENHDAYAAGALDDLMRDKPIDRTYAKLVKHARVPGAFPPTVSVRLRGWSTFDNKPLRLGGEFVVMRPSAQPFPAATTTFYLVKDAAKMTLTNVTTDSDGAERFVGPMDIVKGATVLVIVSPPAYTVTNGEPPKINAHITAQEVYIYPAAPAAAHAKGGRASGPSMGTLVGASSTT